MSESKKPSLWDRLLGRDTAPHPAPEPQPVPEPVPAAPPREDAPAEDPAGPPETRPEWIESGRPDAPEPEPDTPETVYDPFDAAPEQLEPEPLVEPAFEPQAEPEPEPEPEPLPLAQPVPEKRTWYQRLSEGLKRSSDSLSTSITSVFVKRRLDEATLQNLEDILIQADLGIETTAAITDRLRAEKFDKDISTSEVHAVLAEEVEAALSAMAQPLRLDLSQKPFVILMVGVNGSGKTTTIGKLTAKYKAEGHSLLLAAGDTFRAAAVEQLQIWGQRNGTEVLTRPTGADAAGLAYDAVSKAKADGTDIVIIDTAGRLQNRTELMDELEKVIRVIKKLDPGAPHATLLTLDATTGQNALNQVEIFGQKAGVTGLVMTKLDGTARGGILVAIAKKFGLPIHFIGVGEAIGDLEPFQARDFARAMVGQPQGRE